MALLALITFANVLVRYFTNQSFAWTEEISVFLMIVLALVGSAAAVARNSHIRIEFFADNGPARRRRLLARFGALMTALLFTLIAVLSSRTLYDDLRYGETSPGIGVPQWWYTVWLPLLSAVIALRAFGIFLRHGKKGEDERQDGPPTGRSQGGPAPSGGSDPHAVGERGGPPSGGQAT
ncbi:tripartite ATP-independent periplasmic [Hylemonella gracilis ATCC 19624]|uniref:TRAP transporter small permease protein n=1 Tax=Hylemonella gracilis ATCC 19624 TaxID=887062 RepID=F3KVY1_9BURK|nr:tripartite ATP-independent periplasmic [Hylemonella gracilis ATCC 19624]